MHGFKLGHILLLGALTVLPGCLAINAALGLFGVIGPPAAQLAGAAYTVAEYSYEYGAHDRAPDEVFLAKFDWLLEEGDEPDPAAFAGALSAAIPGPQMADGPLPAMTVADAGDGIGSLGQPVVRPSPRRALRPVVVARNQRPARPTMKAMPVKTAGRPAPVRRAAQSLTPVVRAAAVPEVREPARTSPPSRPAPAHTYVAHAPNPLQARIDRLENGLAQAEALYLSEGTDGLRLSVPPCDGDPCAQGVNGGHSLRLPIMRSVPESPPAQGQDRPQSGPASIRSLNT